jgi:hypothetical protein
MIGCVPSWAMDVYSREGRAAFARFLNRTRLPRDGYGAASGQSSCSAWRREAAEQGADHLHSLNAGRWRRGLPGDEFLEQRRRLSAAGVVMDG